MKITNTLGLTLIGKRGDMIFQRRYGKNIIRKGFKREYESTPSQIAAMGRFKAGTKFFKSLSYEQKEKLKKYYNDRIGGWVDGSPSTWYNWVKVFAMQIPRFTIIKTCRRKYRIVHQGIRRITERGINRNILFEVDGLSSIDNLIFQRVFEQEAHPQTVSVEVVTLAGVPHSFSPAEWQIIPCCFETGCFEAGCFTG